MSSDDIDVVRRSFAPWSERDADALADFYTEDVVFHSATLDLVGKTVVGLEGLRKAMAQMFDDWATMRWEIDEIFEAEAGVVSLHRVIGVGRASGLEVTNAIASIYEMRDGRICREWVYEDRGEALAAAGARK
jgi:ketosteroid isomerase-like protein